MSALNIYPLMQYSLNQTLTPTNMNNPLAAIQAWSTTLDNTNVGAAGFFASQIVPLNTTQATFGGAVGYTFAPGSTTQVPLTVSAVSGQSADIFDVTLTSGGTKVFSLDSSGNALFANASFTVNPSGAVRQLVVNAAFGPVGLNFYASAVSITAPSSPGSVATGDIVAQRSTTVGRFYAGGAANFGFADYNGLNANSWTFENSTTFAPIFAGAYTNSSDARLKDNIALSIHGTDAIMALKPSSFTMKELGTDGLGFIAQDVQGVLPMLVSTDVNGMMGVCYDGIIPVLVKHCQEEVAVRQQMQAALKAAGIPGF